MAIRYCQAISKRSKQRCKSRATKDSDYTLCYHHGGAPGSGGDGRPVVHALYSKHVPADWKPDYEYFKTDPQILSLESDIAVARVARARFLKNVEGAALTAEIADTILEHGIKIGKLVEIHNKVQYGERQHISIDQVACDVAGVVNSACPEDCPHRAKLAEGLRRLGESK